jgi:molybdopterin converting factor small subunit
VQLFSRLKEIVGSSDLELEIHDGMTAAQLLMQLYGSYPALRQWDSSILIGAGIEFVGRDYVLKPDDDIAIMPPVQGG